jgi:diguanylate cyclase (GGDEF)-like protein
LLNRREFDQRLEKALLNAQAGGEECSILFIDLDRFKPVNDTCGHLAGDELLRQISQLFQGRLRDVDTLARVGGDEFCILLANCTGPRARQVAEDICGLAAAYRFIWQDKVFAIGASIGLSTVSRNVRNINDILAACDAACYQAKESGRNQVVEQTPSSQPDRRHEANGWSERITRALADGRVLIEAMPLRALQPEGESGHLVEISARLSEPGQPSVSLSALIDAAERNDLAPTVDRYFIDQAITALARAEKHGKELHCLVPISLASICQSTTATYIAEQLSRFNVAGRGLCLLFSEEESARKSTQVLEFSKRVRSVGCRIALDNFGGGLSSFSHLRAIAPDCVKLSRSLTRDLNGNRASTALLRAVQEITSDLEILTLADGVDDPGGLQQLSALGITYAEGLAVAPSEPFQVWFEGVVMRQQS